MNDTKLNIVRGEKTKREKKKENKIVNKRKNNWTNYKILKKTIEKGKLTEGKPNYIPQRVEKILKELTKYKYILYL